MHELSIAMSLIDLAADEAGRGGAAAGVKVVAIHLRLGPLSGVAPEALMSAYQLAREGSPLAEASLVITEIPIVAWCSACDCERQIESVQRLCCPVCHSPTPDIRGGRELEMTGMEIIDLPR